MKETLFVQILISLLIVLSFHQITYSLTNEIRYAEYHPSTRISEIIETPFVLDIPVFFFLSSAKIIIIVFRTCTM